MYPSYRKHLAKGRRIKRRKQIGAKLNLSNDDMKRLYEKALNTNQSIEKLPEQVYDERQSSIQRWKR